MSGFARRRSAGRALRVDVDGRLIEAVEGESVACALLAAGIVTFRYASVSRAPRGPYCLMGVCFECLVEIDGEPACQACLTPVRAGMRVRTAAPATDGGAP